MIGSLHRLSHRTLTVTSVGRGDRDPTPTGQPESGMSPIRPLYSRRRQRALVALMVMALAPPAYAERTLGSLTFAPCTLTNDGSAQTVEAQCTTLRVPENRAEPDGRAIELAIAWVPSTTAQAQPDPVFMLAGGPGQGARDGYVGVASAFAQLRRNRHIILVDQRGTGGSNPLACRGADGENAFTEGDETDPVAAAAFARRCLESLDADPRFYSTGEAIDDLDAVRAAIGAEQINLVGISYGTRVAQQYARRYAARTRSLVLDGLVPNSLVLGTEHAKNLEAALDAQFARCAADPVCKERFGDTRADLDALLATLRTEPPLVRHRDPVTFERREERLSAESVATVVRLFSYSPVVAAMLPMALHEAAGGDYETLAAQAAMIPMLLGGSITHGMQLSVICTEDASEFVVDPADTDSVLGTLLLDLTRAQCAVWPKGTRDPDFRKPLDTPVPTLLLSGEFDPVTPPRYGDEVARHLPNSRHLVARGIGHNVVVIGCMPRVLGEFIDDIDPKGLDAECLDELTYTAPFTGHHGWEP
jgi:pimeloyl-ACP methyl ester carboxylesterase